MKTLNPLFKRYLTYAIAIFAATAIFIVFNYVTQSRTIMSNYTWYTENYHYYASSKADVQNAIVDITGRVLVMYINMCGSYIGVFASLLCLFIYFEQKQLHPGFLNILPVRKKSFFNCAAISGFTYVILSYTVVGLTLPAFIGYADPLNEYALDAITGLYRFIAKYYSLRFAMCLCFFCLCLLFQQLLNKPVVSYCVALITAFVPQLLLGMTDKFLYASGYKYLSQTLGAYSRTFTNYFVASGLYEWADGAASIYSLYLPVTCLYLAMAAVFFIFSLKCSPRAPVYAIGLYSFAWVRPCLMCGFILCMAAAFANYLPRFMGINVMDYSVSLMLLLFALGLLAGYYMYTRLSALLDN